MLAIIPQILHAGFLGAAQDQTDAVLHFDAQLAEHLHDVQAHNGGGFVVRHAATDQEIAHAGGPVGRIDPLVALGHYVQMGHDADAL